MIAFFQSLWLTIREFFSKENFKKLWDWLKSLVSKEESSTSPPSDQSPRITTVIEDNSGGYSSMRVALLATLFTVLFFWGWAAYDDIHRHQPLPDLPKNVLILVLGVGGGKIIQKLWE